MAIAVEAPPMPPAPALTPAAPSAPVAPPPSQAQAEIHVTDKAVDVGPQETPRKGSAKESLFKELRKKAGAEPEPEPAPQDKPAPKSEEKPAAETAPEPHPEPTGKKEKVNPWKLLDEHKAARAKAEAEIADLRKLIPNPEASKKASELQKQTEARIKELEDEIRFVNYAKSQEFQDKYQKPYEEAWKRWMGDLRELTVEDSQRGERPIEPADILELVNLPLPKARERAERVFGDFSDDVMAARKELRTLFEAQDRALSEAREKGSEREAQMVKQFKEQREQASQQINASWEREKAALTKDEKFGRFFQPIEGDEEGNSRLQKGFELADRAFQVNPFDPKLTPAEREDIIKLHVAIRNRAAAAGRLIFFNEKLTAENASLKAELAKYKGTEPGAGQSPRSQAPVSGGSARDRLFGELRKIAH